MVPTRARAGGAPPPPPAPTKAQKAELAAIKKAQNARTKAEKVAAKAIEKATKDEQKATAKDVKDGEKAAAKAEKEKAKAAKTLKPKTSNKTPAEAKRSKNVTKVTNAKTSKRNRVAKAPPTPADSESEESGEEDEQVPGPKKRRVENSASHAYVEIQARKSAHEKKKAGFPDSILINMKEWDYSKELPYPEDLETKIEGPLPAIYVGGSAPQPRWLVTQNKSMPQPPGLYSKIGSRRSSLTDYGKLVWYLDGGSFNNWGGLEYPQLEELAFKCFEHWLKDPALRDEIHESLSNGSLPEFVTSSESWYPTLPPTPLTRYFGRTEFGLPIWDCPPKSHEGYYYKDYDRPSLAVQRPTSERRSHQDVLATKMLEHKVMQSGTGSADSSVEQSQSPAPPASLGSLTGPSQVGKETKNPSIDSNDCGDGARCSPNSTNESREQFPDSQFSQSSSEAEVSSSLETSAAPINDVDDISAKSTHNSIRNSSVSSHDGLFSASQIEEYYNNKKKEFKQDKLGGRGTRKQLENLLGQYDEAERKGKGREGDEKGKEREDARKKHDEEMRKLTKQAEAAEAQAGAQQDEEEDAEELASSQDKMDLSDPFLDQATKAIADPDIRKKHFHDPICFRRVRMWAGEDLTKQPAQKAQINTVLPAWAGLQRPFKHLHAAPGVSAPARGTKRKGGPLQRSRRKRRPLSDYEPTSFSQEL